MLSSVVFLVFCSFYFFTVQAEKVLLSGWLLLHSRWLLAKEVLFIGIFRGFGSIFIQIWFYEPVLSYIGYIVPGITSRNTQQPIYRLNGPFLDSNRLRIPYRLWFSISQVEKCLVKYGITFSRYINFMSPFRGYCCLSHPRAPFDRWGYRADGWENALL